MIRSEYNPATDNVTVTVTGDHDIVLAELSALRKVLTSRGDLIQMWLDSMEKEIKELEEKE